MNQQLCCLLHICMDIYALIEIKIIYKISPAMTLICFVEDEDVDVKLESSFYFHLINWFRLLYILQASSECFNTILFLLRKYTTWGLSELLRLLICVLGPFSNFSYLGVFIGWMSLFISLYRGLSPEGTICFLINKYTL